MYKQIMVSAISMKPVKWDKARNVAKLTAFVKRAARRGSDLVVATEGVIEGYVSAVVKKHREQARAMLEIAEPVDGPSILHFRNLARSLKVCLCFGFAERLGMDVYNSAVFIDHRGRICGIYRKHEEPFLSAGGRSPVWHANRGRRRLRAFDTPLGRCGIMICADRWYSWIARTLVLDGARFLLVPTFGSKERPQNQTVLARARENGVPIAQANTGANLLISRGEVVAYQWGVDRITTAPIDVPEPPSPKAARRYERDYLRRRETEKWQWLVEAKRVFPPPGARIGAGKSGRCF